MPYFDIFLWWSKHLVTSTIIRCFYVTIHRRMGHNRHTVDEFGFILNHVFEGNQWILRHGFLHVFYLMCDYHHPSFDRRKRSFNHFFFSFFNTLKSWCKVVSRFELIVLTNGLNISPSVLSSLTFIEFIQKHIDQFQVQSLIAAHYKVTQCNNAPFTNCQPWRLELRTQSFQKTWMKLNEKTSKTR